MMHDIDDCYLIIGNAEASLVEIESRDRHCKRKLLLLNHGCNMNVNGAIQHVMLHRRFLPLKKTE